MYLLIFLSSRVILNRDYGVLTKMNEKYKEQGCFMIIKISKNVNDSSI